MTDTATRPISTIASEIAGNWKKINFAAKPYLEAMFDLEDPDDQYFADSGKSIVRYFLSNATTWRGDTAKRIRAELKALIGD